MAQARTSNVTYINRPMSPVGTLRTQWGRSFDGRMLGDTRAEKGQQSPQRSVTLVNKAKCHKGAWERPPLSAINSQEEGQEEQGGAGPRPRGKPIDPLGFLPTIRVPVGRQGGQGKEGKAEAKGQGR